MEEKEFAEELEKLLSKIGIIIEYDNINKFYKYMNMILEWNEKINLTAITEPKEIILKHFVDCGTLLNLLENKSKVLDLGTGAGFPGIPLKILNKELDIVLSDSLNKRINFLNEVIKEMNLTKITTIHSRAEDLAIDKKYREKYDIVVSRAVANMPVLLEYTLPFLRVGGKSICMKGPNIEEEISNSHRALKVLGGEIEEIKQIILPNSNIIRNIVIVKKIKNTPIQYPRKAGKPSKEPII